MPFHHLKEEHCEVGQDLQHHLFESIKFKIRIRSGHPSFQLISKTVPYELSVYLVHVECEKLESRPVPVRGQRVRHQLLVAHELLLAKLAHAVRGFRLFLQSDGEVLGFLFVPFPPSIWPPLPSPLSSPLS